MNYSSDLTIWKCQSALRSHAGCFFFCVVMDSSLKLSHQAIQTQIVSRPSAWSNILSTVIMKIYSSHILHLKKQQQNNQRTGLQTSYYTANVQVELANWILTWMSIRFWGQWWIFNLMVTIRLFFAKYGCICCAWMMCCCLFHDLFSS